MTKAELDDLIVWCRARQQRDMNPPYRLNGNYIGGYGDAMRAVMSHIHDMKKQVELHETETVAHVIRCKDCQAWGRSPYGHPTIGWCIVHGRHRSPDYFCASAKKRESVEVKVNG